MPQDPQKLSKCCKKCWSDVLITTTGKGGCMNWDCLCHKPEPQREEKKYDVTSQPPIRDIETCGDCGLRTLGVNGFWHCDTCGIILCVDCQPVHKYKHTSPTPTNKDWQKKIDEYYRFEEITGRYFFDITPSELKSFISNLLQDREAQAEARGYERGKKEKI